MKGVGGCPEEKRKRSPIRAELEKDGKIILVGAVYSLHDGKVTLLSKP